MAEKVTFLAKSGAPSGGAVAFPAGGAKAPGLVLVQEYWGVNGHILDLADRFAAAGFLVVAPDLYHGVIATDAAEAGKLMTGLDVARALDDISGAVRYLLAHARCSGKVGITGFCMGGAYAFIAASRIPEISAAVPFYGIPSADRADFTKTCAPIMAHVATNDAWVTVPKAQAIKDQLAAHGQSMTLHVYDAQHAFMNDTRPEVYAPEAAKLAWDRTVAFLHGHLDAVPTRS